MVKRKDGKKYKFDNNDKVVDSGNPAKAAIAASPGATAETNRQRIEQYNSILPEFKGKPKDKEAKRLFCAMGYGADSQLTDDNVEITTECGIWDRIEDAGVFQLGRVADDAALADQNAAADKGARADFCPGADDAGTGDRSGRRNFNVFCNPDVR